MSNAAGSVSIVLSVNQANFSQAMTNAQRQLDAFAGKAKGAGHSTVSGMQAASASIRLLENPLGNNTRAIERLISQSKLLSGVMKAAFPLVGAVAMGSILVKLGTDAAEFIKKVQAMPKAISQAFQAATLGQQTATDELVVSTDKLQNHIDKLMHQPENTLKLEFDEARLAADRLAGSIVSANAKLNELLSKNHLSGWSLLLGKPGTSEREGTTKAFSDQADSNAYDLANAAPGSPQEAAAKKALHDTQNAQLAEARRDLAKRVAGAAQPDGLKDAANINIDKGIITTILNSEKQDAAAIANQQTQTKDAQVQAAHDAAEARKQAASQAAAAQRAADEKRIKAMQDALDHEKLLGNVSVKATYDFWAARVSAFKQGSAAYLEVEGKATAAAVEGAAKAHELIQRQKELNKHEDSTDELSGNEIAMRGADFLSRENGKAFATSNADQVDTNQLAMTDAANAAREREAELTEQSGKTLSHYAEAAQLAAVHTKEYVTQLSALQAILDVRQGEARANPTSETNKALEQAQAQLADAQSKRVIQVQHDDDNVNPASSLASVGFADALRDFVTSSRDAAGQMRELTTNTLESLNSELVKGMTGQKTNFKAAGAGIFRNVAATGLKKAEGMLLGGGAADGSQSKPLYVKMVDGLGKAGDAASGLLGKMGNSLSGAKSGTGGFISSLIGMLPAFAAGGAISANMLSVVGENGPELFSPGTSGSIVPNHKIMSGDSGVGGNTYYHVAVANGVTPEQMNMHVRSALQQFHPHVVQSSVQAMKANQNRTPMSKR